MDYKKLNLKIGLELHSQLSGKKLFCSCNTDLNEQNEEIQIKRKLRATVGEFGEKDVAGLYEEARDRTFVYHGYGNEFCLVETDSEPIHNINQEALETALAVAKLLKLKIPKTLKVMRKQIFDGSCCSSFQRLVICGEESKNSYIKTSKGKVKISLLSLEEDACKIIKSNNDEVHYSLSRQGIPLLELRTEPDIKTPEQAKEAAGIIGMILRSFPLTRRGIGSIRQDINLSIKNGSRVELKGFQNLKQMPKVIDIEIKRQLNLLKKEKKVPEEVRRVKEDNTTEFLRPLPGEARSYPETDHFEIPVTTKFLYSIKLPELIAEKTLNLEKRYNLPAEIAKQIVKEKINFEDYVKKYSRVSPVLIGTTLTQTPKEIKSRFKIKPKLKTKDFHFVFSALNKNEITKQAILDILLGISRGGKPDLKKYKPLSFSKIEKKIKKIIAANRGASFNALMGIAMKRFNNTVDGKKIAELIKKFK